MCFTTALTLITKVITREGGTENMPEAVDVAEQASTMCKCKCSGVCGVGVRTYLPISPNTSDPQTNQIN